MKHRILSLLMLLALALGAEAQQKVIAHRGYWDTEGSAQNSRASLRKALALGIYGSETDIWLITDDHLAVNHDPARDGVELQSSKWKDCKKLRLKNGERLPELKDLLKIMRKSQSPTKLIIEIKPHKTTAQDHRAADLTVEQVRRYGLENSVEYISFSLEVCKRLHAIAPEAKVAYLRGELSPKEIKALGLTGIDYEQGVIRKHPDWVKACHELGLSVNVWTVNKVKDMEFFHKLGVDYITSNAPLDCIRVTSGTVQK